MEPETIHQQATAVFMWATILSAVFLILSSVTWLAFKGSIRSLHARWFAIGPEVVDVAVYAYLAILKLGAILLFLIPWLALVITRS